MRTRTIALVLCLVLVVSAFSFLVGSMRTVNASADFLAVSISPTDAKLGVGETQVFVATVSNRDASYLPYFYSWTDGSGQVLGTGQTLSFSFSEPSNGTVLSVTVISARGNQGYASVWVADPYTSASVYLDALQTGWVVQSDGLGWFGAFYNGKLMYSSATANTLFTNMFGAIGSGKTVHILSGAYTGIYWNNIIPSNTTVVFEKGAKLVGLANYEPIFIYSKRNIVLQGGEIDGNYANHAVVDSITSDGIVIDTSSNVLVTGMYIHDCRRFGGYVCEASTFCGFTYCNITRVGWNPLNLGNHPTALFLYADHNEISYFKDVGIAAFGLHTSITNNYIHTTASSAFSGALNTTVGISYEDGGGASGQGIIQGNVIDDMHSWGIYTMPSVDNNIISENTITNIDTGHNYRPAIWVQGDNNTIEDNQILGTRGGTMGGITIQLGVHNHIVGNNIIGGDMSGVYISSADYTTISNNLIAGDNGGIKIDSSASDYTYIFDNDLTPSSSSAIVDSGTNTWIWCNPGYNPKGYIANPFSANLAIIVDAGNNATMSSARTYTNTESPKTVYITGGTVTAIVQNGQTLATSATTMCLVLQPGDTFSITFSSAPTLKVMGQ